VRILKSIFQAAALAPAALKCPFYRQIMGGFARRSGMVAEAFVTNLGMDADYRLHLSPPLDPLYLFGTPDQYLGEAGALYLARFFSQRCRAFLDIGAHRGYFVFFVRTQLSPEIPIYFFEPNPVLFRELSETVERCLANIHGVQAAIGGVKGRAKLYMQDCHSSMSSIRPEYLQQSVTESVSVDVTTFDEFARSKELCNLCVKVDVENAEDDFLAGAREEYGRIDYLIIEILGPAVQRGFVRDLKQHFGMASYYINEYSLEHSPDGTFRYVSPQYNWLFCRQHPAVLRDLLQGTRFQVKD
jgi:FkbM family methyltransferase